MDDHVLLLLSIPTLSRLRNPQYLGPAVLQATAVSRSSLLIAIFSPLFNDPEHGGLVPVHQWRDVQLLLTYLYVEAARVTQENDNVLLSVNIVLHGTDRPSESRFGPSVWNTVYVLDADELVPFDSLPISALPTTIISPPEPIEESNMPQEETPQYHDHPPVYPVSALGGTFDHLHAGHKILLSIAAWIASQKVIVGVTDSALLVNKSNASVLEPLPVRMNAVRRFGMLFKPSLQYDIVPINDVYGPTGWDPNIQALVLSHETREGAAAIAKHRKEHVLPPLTPFIIDVISASSVNLDPEDVVVLKSAKMSSTAIREWIVAREKKTKVEEERLKEAGDLKDVEGNGPSEQSASIKDKAPASLE